MGQGAQPGSAAAGDLWRALDRSRSQRPLLSVWSDDGFVHWSWDDWRARAGHCAAGLQRLGVVAGDRVGYLLSNSAEACAALLGGSIAGAEVVSMPLLPRGMALDAYVDQLRRIVASELGTK